jgi:hypothetical protein
MMENHSYDNRLGMPFRPGADGFRLGKGGPPTATNPYPNGHRGLPAGRPAVLLLAVPAVPHTSILKLAETKWNLPALTYRDANAAAMLDMLHLRRPSFTSPRLAQPLAVTDPSALSCSTTGPGTIPPPGSITG